MSTSIGEAGRLLGTLARGGRLTPHEAVKLERWANKLDNSSTLVDGWSDLGSRDVSADHIRAKSGEFDTPPLEVEYFQASNQVIQTSGTFVSGWFQQGIHWSGEFSTGFAEVDAADDSKINFKPAGARSRLFLSWIAMVNTYDNVRTMDCHGYVYEPDDSLDSLVLYIDSLSSASRMTAIHAVALDDDDAYFKLFSKCSGAADEYQYKLGFLRLG